MKLHLAILTLGLATTISGCGYYWNEEAGAFLDGGEFGSATLNNQVQHTCRQVTAYNVSKYGNPIGSGCPGRTQDGKYALFAYNETVQSATEQHSSALEEASITE